MAQPKNKQPSSPSEWVDQEIPTRLPIIPLVSSVLFPGGVLSLQVGIDRNVRLLKSIRDEQPDTFADLLSSFVNFPLEEKQLLLETVNPIERLELLIDWIQRDLGKATMDRELQRQIKDSIDRRERESYLREQLRVIQDELGDTNAAEREADTYRDRIEALPLAEEQKLQLRREVNRLGQLSPSSSDYAVIKGHLDTVFQVPWSEKTEDKLDLKRAEESLEERHHGLEKVKERVLEFLAVLKLKGDLKGPILCFAGPPGVGKTSLGAAIADALGRKFIRMAVGGVTDESEIRGHRKTYIGAMPGKLIQSYIQVGVNNPLIMIDEIDKIGKDFRGDPASALLEVLDPKQNHAFVDRYVAIPDDRTHTPVIATAT